MLFLYLLENSIVHSVDALLLGGGFYLLRFTRHVTGGAILVVLYGMATLGLITSNAFDAWGLAMAVVGCVIAETIGRARARRRLKQA